MKYLDFGNEELRGQESLTTLGADFKEIPFLAVTCSIANENHSSFTEKVSIEAVLSV